MSDAILPADPAELLGFDTLGAPALAVGFREAVWLTADGEVETLDHREAARRTARTPAIVCHAPSVARRLRRDDLPLLDVLELYAFVRPATFALPTVQGLAAAVGLAPPHSLEDQALALLDIPRRLAAELVIADEDISLQAMIGALADTGWPWARWLKADAASDKLLHQRGMDIWNRLPEIEEQAPPPPGNHSVSAAEALDRLDQLLDDQAEVRPQQQAYAEAAAQAYAPRAEADAPVVVLAEAGTGIGKTLGYIAPASVWAQKNEGVVWISTYTKNLQRQLDQELRKLYPDPRLRAEKAVLHKGRENYLCLLNLEDEVGRSRQGRAVASAALMARWAGATRDGDMVGGDFPSWLAHLFGPARTLGLTDRRGECVYSACAHYKKCFIEHVQRRARRAEIVVANHALVMIQAAMADEDTELPTRYVFDEGHHVFDAADSAFSANLCGQETAELRRWIRGA